MILEKKIDEVIINKKGGASLKPDEFVEDGFPVLHKGAIKISGKVEIDIYKKAFVNEKTKLKHINSVVNQNYVVVTLRDLVPTGPSIGLMSFLANTNNAEFLLAQGAYGFQVNEELVDPKYMVWWSNTPQYKSVISKYWVGSTQIHLRSSVFFNLKIPLQSLKQQKKIVNILDAADALRQNDKALIVKYDELTQALFLDMFGDPVSNSKGWEKEELGKVLDVRDGTHDSPKYKENGYALVTSKNIKNGKLILDDVNYISEADYNKINLRSKVDIGDIIMPMIGTIGNPLLVDFEVNFAIKNVALFKFKENSIIINKMLLNLLNGHFLERFSSLNNKGGTQKFVSLGDIRKMIVPIPPLHLQNQFAERVAVIEEQKAIAQKSLEHSESLFNSLLQKAFKRELV